MNYIKVYHIENIVEDGHVGRRWSLLQVLHTKHDALTSRKYWRDNFPEEEVRIVKVERTVLP